MSVNQKTHPAQSLSSFSNTDLLTATRYSPSQHHLDKLDTIVRRFLALNSVKLTRQSPPLISIFTIAVRWWRSQYHVPMILHIPVQVAPVKQSITWKDFINAVKRQMPSEKIKRKHSVQHFLSPPTVSWLSLPFSSQPPTCLPQKSDSGSSVFSSCMCLFTVLLWLVDFLANGVEKRLIWVALKIFERGGNDGFMSGTSRWRGSSGGIGPFPTLETDLRTLFFLGVILQLTRKPEIITFHTVHISFQ